MAGRGRAQKVQNRAPAAIQVSAEQLVLEAQERQDEAPSKAPKQHITDREELDEFKQAKRKGFEDAIRMQRMHVGNFIKYALWEESQTEFERARSVFERAIDVDYRNVSTWVRYAEMEMKHKFVNRARNVWDRAVALLPRVDQLWLKYTYMEEMVGNVKGARVVFERWMEWEPNDRAWLAYIKLEDRAGEVDRARALYERYVAAHFSLLGYLRYAKWEDYTNGQPALARGIYERASTELPPSELDQRLHVQFARFEIRCKEIERARAIFKHGLDTLPEADTSDLRREFINFEKQYGDKQGIEEVIVGKRRYQYQEAVAADPHNYDAWFDYARLEEAEIHNTGSGKDALPREERIARVRDVYERAIANLPPIAEKKYWQRYIYLWINYALFEELDADDVAATRAVYQASLDVIPHGVFTFGKLWLYAAKFEVRNGDLSAARKLLGRALGVCPKENIMKGYIELELQLGEISRCRQLYEKYIDLAPQSYAAWVKYAELEESVDEESRARAIFELAVSQSVIDMPERLWKAYIDFEVRCEKLDLARTLYERLLDRTKHVKVWMSFAAFEAGAGEIDNARSVYKRAAEHLKQLDAPGEERALLFEARLAFERAVPGGKGQVEEVLKNKPHRVRKEREIYDEDGNLAGRESFFEYSFPEDMADQTKILNFMAKAQAWQAGQKRGRGDGGDGSPEEEAE